MRKLKDAPFEELRMGDKAISILGKNGTINNLDRADNNLVEITWEDGNESGGYHPDWDDRIRYSGR